LNTPLKGLRADADEQSMAAAPDVAQRAVEELGAHYQAKARSVARLGVAVGATVGLFVGSVPLTPLRFAWPIPSQYGFATILSGLCIGVLIGYVIGDARARLYRRMAEQARLQLQLEQRISANDARIAELVAELQARVDAPPVEAEETPERPVPHLSMAPPLALRPLPPVSA
jgi:hypothetical protein